MFSVKEGVRNEKILKSYVQSGFSKIGLSLVRYFGRAPEASQTEIFS